MPEGPEVRTVANTLAQKLVGHKLGKLWHSDFSLRRKVDYERLGSLQNAAIDGVTSYGKMLFISVEQKTAMLAQLGMTGQLKVENADAPVLPHTHIRWPLLNTPLEIRYVDPRRFGLIEACDEEGKKAIISKLGPDPFYFKKKDYPALIFAIKRSRRAIKEVLLDQSVIAGVGNIYASEALFRAFMHPETPAYLLKDSECRVLFASVLEVMEQAFENSGTTFSNYVDGTGQKGNNQAFLRVFQRESLPCILCRTSILRITQGGRSTFFCPRCQNRV